MSTFVGRGAAVIVSGATSAKAIATSDISTSTAGSRASGNRSPFCPDLHPSVRVRGYQVRVRGYQPAPDMPQSDSSLGRLYEQQAVSVS